VRPGSLSLDSTPGAGRSGISFEESGHFPYVDSIDRFVAAVSGYPLRVRERAYCEYDVSGDVAMDQPCSWAYRNASHTR
jgi:hypothetical protein